MADDWTKLTGDELGREVVAVGRSLWEADSARRGLMLRNICRYEGREIASLESWAATSIAKVRGGEIEDEAIRCNMSRSLVDTVTSKIAGTQQPKVSFVASNADYRTRRKGPKMQAAVDGVWSSTQGPYSDIWDLGVAIFRDAAVCGFGAIKVESDTDAGRIDNSRPFPWELLVDARDAKAGNPSNLWQVHDVPMSALRAWHPEAVAKLEEYRGRGSDDDVSLGPNTSQMASSSKKVVDMVRCFEWWSLPQSKDCPGKHVLAFDGGVLIEEDWTRQSFPFAILRWSREFSGWHGRGLIDDVAAIDDEMNDLIARVVRTVRLTGMGRTYKHEDDTSPDEDNDDAVTIRFSGAIPPVTQAPSPISPVHVQLIELLKSFGYEFSGVNQMTATAQKQAGVEAASAIRLVADLQSERFAPVWRSYQQLYVQLARLTVDCIRELYEADPKFSVRWSGEDFIKSIQWGDVDLDDDLFVIRIDSAPSVKGTPADRMQTAQELFAMGKLSADALLAVQQSSDLPGELERLSTHTRFIDEMTERWLDATPEQIEANTLDGKRPLFVAPIKLMNLEPALLRVLDGYLEAELEAADDEIKELFLRWIEMADKEIQARAARVAALSRPPAPAMGPGAPMPPMPPGEIAA